MNYKKWIIIVLFFVYMFFNLGRFLDLTSNPQKADVIVYLGGGESERIEKSLELYKKGYSDTDILIYTGSKYYAKRIYHITGKRYLKHNKKDYFIKNGILTENLIHAIKNNTANEIKFILKYLFEHQLSSVMFITDPPHSRRVYMFIDIFDKYVKNIKVHVVSSGVTWWDKDRYYLNKKAIKFVISELIKLPYNYFVYGVLKEYGLYDSFKDNFGGIMKVMKNYVNNIMA